jgi:hypothetical protein
VTTRLSKSRFVAGCQCLKRPVLAGETEGGMIVYKAVG